MLYAEKVSFLEKHMNLNYWRFADNNGRFTNCIIETIYEVITRFDLVPSIEKMGYKLTSGHRGCFVHIHKKIVNIDIMSHSYGYRFSPKDVVWVIYHEMGHLVDALIGRIAFEVNNSEAVFLFEGKPMLQDEQLERLQMFGCNTDDDTIYYSSHPVEKSANTFAALHCPVIPEEQIFVIGYKVGRGEFVNVGN